MSELKVILGIRCLMAFNMIAIFVSAIMICPVKLIGFNTHSNKTTKLILPKKESRFFILV